MFTLFITTISRDHLITVLGDFNSLYSTHRISNFFNGVCTF